MKPPHFFHLNRPMIQSYDRYSYQRNTIPHSPHACEIPFLPFSCKFSSWLSHNHRPLWLPILRRRNAVGAFVRSHWCLFTLLTNIGYTTPCSPWLLVGHFYICQQIAECLVHDRLDITNFLSSYGKWGRHEDKPPKHI